MTTHSARFHVKKTDPSADDFIHAGVEKILDMLHFIPRAQWNDELRTEILECERTTGNTFFVYSSLPEPVDGGYDKLSVFIVTSPNSSMPPDRDELRAVVQSMTTFEWPPPNT